jgi:hypothetical protein
MSMPIFAWVAYVYKAAKQHATDVMDMVVAASIPHMERGDRQKTLAEIQRPLVVEEEVPPTKEEYIASMMAVGIAVELN